MKRALIVAALSVGLAAGFANVAIADDDDDDRRSAFALFDATNPANQDLNGRSGVVCGVSNKNQTALVPRKSFTYHVAVTNFGGVPLECKVIYTDLDFVRYKIPSDTSFSFSQAAGSGFFDAAVRLECDANVSGSVSVQGPKRVFCVSCDANDLFCDLIIATP